MDPRSTWKANLPLPDKLRKLAPCLSLTLLVGGVSSCGDREEVETGFAVRDSAGITIVESLEPAWSEGEGWSLSPEPILDIGVVEGDPAYLLSGVEDVARRPDGQVVVVNRRPLEIRVYDGDGRFIRSVGQEGEGPGEFQDIYGVLPRAADTIAVFAFPPGLTTFGPSGALVEEVSLLGLGQPLGQPSALADGSFIIPWRMESEFELLAAGRVRQGETVRPRLALVLHGPDGLPRDTIGVFPGHGVTMLETGGSTPSDFGPRFTYSAAAREVYVGTGEGYEILVFAPGSGLTRILRRSGVDLRVTEAAKDSLLDVVTRGLSDPSRRAAVTQQYTGRPYPAERAPYWQIVADPEGYLVVSPLGVRAWHPPFDVFDRDGRWLGRLRLPEDFVPFELGEDYILGVATDELGVEHVRMYGLTK